MIDTEIIDFFMEEAEELFDGMNSILLKNEEAGDIDKEEIDSLFRNMHTIKGGAGSVGLINLGNYTHHLETFLDMIKDGEVSLSKDIINFLIESVSTMQDILDEEYAETIDENNTNRLIKELKAKIDVFVGNSTAQVEATPIQNIPEASAAEIIDLFDQVFAMLNEAESSNDSTKVEVAELFRYIHTLKGSAQFLYLSYFPMYLHDIENILDDVRNNKFSYTLELNSFLLNTLTIAQEMIDLELNNNLDQQRFDIELKSLKSDLAEFIAPQDDTAPAFEIFDDELDIDMSAFEIYDEPIAKKEIQIIPKKAVVDNKIKQVSPPSQNKSIKKTAASSSIRVNLDKIDSLMNRVGDLVITKSMLFQFSESVKEDSEIYKQLQEKLENLDRDIRELQESVMSVRMVPMESVYARLPKMVRDLAKKLDKKVKFEHFGDNVEIDKMMVEGLMDPLTHIIRNSLDHGIENPDTRTSKNKNQTGLLSITASQESGNIIISIKDDGAGINIDRIVEKALENGIVDEEQLQKMSEEEKVMLVFAPGLSTASEVSDVSGRGVGMDVVMTNINKLGGKVEVKTKKDIGSEFNIVLPLTLAILDGLNIEVGDTSFILPLSSIVESLQPSPHMIKRVSNKDRDLVMLRHEFIPIIKLHSFFGVPSKYTNFEDGMLIIVKSSHTKVALFMDNFLNQEQIVVKSLEKNYKKIKGIGAATIRGDGSIGLILDVMNIIEENKTSTRKEN